MRNLRMACAFAVIGWTLQISSAMAAEADALSDENAREIIVTAQKRETRLQETPIAITAISGDQITKGQITSNADLSARVPGMIVGEASGQSVISVRGVSHQFNTAGAEPGVTVNVDGVVVSQPSSSSLMLFDVASIEVLRGPQGTLYGRNTTGGAVNIRTKAPSSEFYGEVNAVAGSYGRLGTSAVLSGPLSAAVGVRVAALYDDMNGYFRNTLSGERHGAEENYGFRGHLRVEPADNLSLDFRADHQAASRYGSTYRLIEARTGAFAPASPSPWEVRLNFPGYQNKRATTYSGTAELDLGEVTLRSITAYSQNKLNFYVDIDGASFDFLRYRSDNKSKTFTQEVNILGDLDGVDWIVGGFYLDEKLDTRIETRLPVLAPANLLDFDFAQSSKSIAAFGQIGIDITDRLRATAGIRYTHDEKSVVQATPAPNATCPVARQPRSFKSSWNNVSPKVGLEYKFNDDLFGYASYSHGYKAGGYNPTQCGNSFDPEKVKAYEAGLKAQLFDRALTINLAGFKYSYDDYQANVFVNLSNFIVNATSVDTKGIEAELTWDTPVEGLRFSASTGYLDAQFGAYQTLNTFTGQLQQIEGNRVPRSPKFTGNISLDFEREIADFGTLSLTANHGMSGKFYFELLNDPGAVQRAYGNTNIEIGYRTVGGPLESNLGDITIAAFVRNLEDNAILAVASPTVSVGGVLADYGPPRTYGVRLRAVF